MFVQVRTLFVRYSCIVRACSCNARALSVHVHALSVHVREDRYNLRASQRDGPTMTTAVDDVDECERRGRLWMMSASANDEDTIGRRGRRVIAISRPFLGAIALELGIGRLCTVF